MGEVINIYDKARLIQAKDSKPGMIIEAMPDSFSTGDLLIPHITSEPTGVFGYVIGKTIKSYALSECRLGVPIIERVLFDRELKRFGEELRTSSYCDWSNKQGICKLIGELNGIKEKDEKRGGNHLNFFEENSIVLSQDTRETVRRALLEFRNDRDDKQYVFNSSDGKKYSLNEILLNLE